MSKPNVGILATKDWVISLINKVIKKGFNGYSNDEKVIGTWTNGKPLYRKVYDITTPSSANTNTVLFNIGSEIEVKNMYGHIITPNGGVRSVPWNYSKAPIFIFVDPGVFYMNVNDNINVNGRPGQIVLEYTKTTD